MDMFYAAVEIRDNPKLANQPIAIGSANGVIATSNYIARKFGIRSAQPGFVALHLCKDLKLIEPNMRKYTEIAKQIRQIFKKFDSNFESYGLDEGYLEVTKFLQNNPDFTPESTAREIRKQIFETVNITSSAGISCNKMLAKICTDIKKPNDQFKLESDRDKIMQFMAKLNLRKVPFIGESTEIQLNKLGYFTCEDVQKNPLAIKLAFKHDREIRFILDSCFGIGALTHSDPMERKSISVGRTFGLAFNYEERKHVLSWLCEMLVEQIGQLNKVGLSLSVSAKTFKFETKEKIATFSTPLGGDLNFLTQSAFKLLRALEPMDPVRYLCVAIGHLMDPPKKHSLITNYFKSFDKSGEMDQMEIVNEVQNKQQMQMDTSMLEMENQKGLAENNIKIKYDEQEENKLLKPVKIMPLESMLPQLTDFKCSYCKFEQKLTKVGILDHEKSCYEQRQKGFVYAKNKQKNKPQIMFAQKSIQKYFQMKKESQLQIAVKQESFPSKVDQDNNNFQQVPKPQEMNLDKNDAEFMKIVDINTNQNLTTEELLTELFDFENDDQNSNKINEIVANQNSEQQTTIQEQIQEQNQIGNVTLNSINFICEFCQFSSEMTNLGIEKHYKECEINRFKKFTAQKLVNKKEKRKGIKRKGILHNNKPAQRRKKDSDPNQVKIDMFIRKAQNIS